MTVTVKFGAPSRSSKRGYHGLVVTYPFDVQVEGDELARESGSKPTVSVNISGTLLATWGFSGYEDDITAPARVLFQFAKERVLARLQEGSLREETFVSLRISDQPKERPFDPEDLEDSEGQEYVVELNEGENLNLV